MCSKRYNQIHSRKCDRIMRLPWLAVLIFISGPIWCATSVSPIRPGEQVQITDNEIGRYGGQLIVGQRSEPKTLNPVTAADLPSREIIRQTTADLIHINRGSQQTEPSLATSWKMSLDGRTFTLKLRRGIRFSDGHPFDADDVIFSFQVYLDEKVHSPQRDLLVVSGKPISATRLTLIRSAFR